MKQNRRHIRIYAKKSDQNAMSIYMDCSGRRMFLMDHRYVPRMYRLLKDGISLDDLRRSKEVYKFNIKRRNANARRRSQILENSMRHLIRVVDEFIEYEMNDYFEAA